MTKLFPSLHAAAWVKYLRSIIQHIFFFRFRSVCCCLFRAAAWCLVWWLLLDQSDPPLLLILSPQSSALENNNNEPNRDRVSLRKWMQTKRKDEVEESEWMVVRGQIQRMADSAEVILVWLEVTRVYSQDSLACENCFREKRSSRSSTFSLSFYLANNLPYSAHLVFYSLLRREQ